MRAAPESLIRPVVLVDAASLIREAVDLQELALAGGAPLAMETLIEDLKEAHMELRQPMLVVVDRRHVPGLPARDGVAGETGEKPFDLSDLSKVGVEVVHTPQWATVEDGLRMLVAALAIQGERCEVVTSDPALVEDCEGWNVCVRSLHVFGERVERAKARAKAARKRAERELADTESLVGKLVELSGEKTPTEAEEDGK